MCMIIITHQVEYTYNDTIYNDILCYCTVTVMLMVVVVLTCIIGECVRGSGREGFKCEPRRSEQKTMELFDSINRQKIHFLLPVSY